MAANDDFERYYAEKIWALVPEVYKTEDGNQPRRDVLRSIVEVIATQAAVTRRSIDRLWEDQHVETCDDWAVPYIGDLVGTRPLTDKDPRARRVDIARSVFFRRRRGTPILLETMVSELSSWDVVLVEAFRRLARTFHRLDRVPVRLGRFTKTPQGGTADLRNPRAGELQPGPFDEFFHTADVRKLRGLLGWFNIRKLNLHLFRFEVFQIEGADPYQLRDSGYTAYTFDPSGRDIPLFSRGNVAQTNTAVGPVVTLDQNGDPFPLSLFDPRSQVSDCGFPDEWDVRKPIPCRLLGNAQYLVTSEDVGSLVLGAIPSLSSGEIAALLAIVGVPFAGETALRARLEALLGLDFSVTMPAWYPDLLRQALTDDSGKKNLYPSSIALQMQAIQDVVPVEAVTSADLSNRACVNTPTNPAITTLIDPKLGRFAPIALPPVVPTISTIDLALPMRLTSSAGASIAMITPGDVSVFASSSVNSPSIEIGENVAVYRDTTTLTRFGIIANVGIQPVQLSTAAASGDIWSVGNVRLDVAAAVKGSVRTSGTIAALPGQISGARIERARINPRMTVIGAVLPDPPITSSSNWSTDHALAPGDYGKLTMSGGTLTLRPGIYTFEQLTLTTLSKLDLDLLAPGNVYVNIRKQLVYMADTGTFSASRIRFVVFDGDASVGGDSDSPALGTVVATNGAVTVENQRACVGALFGKTVTLGPDTSIRHVAFAAWETPT